MRHPARLLALALALTIAPLGTAYAQKKAWTALQKILPADGVAVVGVDVAAIRSTSLFKTFFTKAVAAEHDAKEGLDRLQKDCAIDPTLAVADVAVAVNKAQDAAFAVAVVGVDEKKITTCIIAIAKSEGEAITAKKVGNVVEYSSSKSTEKIYVAWLAPDVLLVTSRPEDRATLDKFLAGKGLDKANGLVKTLAGVNTKAAIWGAMAMVSAEDVGFGKMSGGYGALDFSAGSISLDGHLLLSSAQEAATASQGINMQIGEMLKTTGQMGPMGPAVGRLLGGVKVSSVANDLLFKASAAEKDILDLMQLAMP
jgi:hypothetical protein